MKLQCIVENCLIFLLTKSTHHSLYQQIILSEIFQNFKSETIMAVVKQTAGTVFAVCNREHLSLAMSP